MSSRFWASSEDLNIDSSFDSNFTHPRDSSNEQHGHQGAEATVNNSLSNGDIQTVARTLTNHARTNVQSQQQGTLLLLSLVEGRCKTQAAKVINRSRRPADQLPEDHIDVRQLSKRLFVAATNDLVQAGIIPEEFAGRQLSELQSYLSAFDAVLNNIATRQAPDLAGLQDISFDDTQPLALAVNCSPSTTLYDYPKVLVRQDLTMAPGRQSKVPEFLKFFYPNARGGESIPKSIYTTEYKQISTLGSGGFGRVYLAQYHVDKCEYAIKKIIVKAKRLRQLADRKKVLNDLHSEVKALAKLNHHNIVRYYHCWLETRPSTGFIDNGGDGSDDSDSSGGGTDSEILITGIQSIALGVERDLLKEMTKDRRRASSISLVLEESKNVIVFEDSSPPGYIASQPSTTRTNSNTCQSDSPDSANDKDEDDGLSSTEEVPRDELLGQIIPYNAEEENEDADMDDCLLYIKMTPYPLSLEDCIWGGERERTAGKVDIAHCFHSLPTIRLLLGILDGVEYLHRQKIIHRDLKPANIFLSVLPPSEPVTYGYVDMSDCKECGSETASIQHTYVCPHIGDFGLIHELKEPQTEAFATPTRKKVAMQPFPFSVAASKQAGTKFYVPSKVPRINPICPRLDVYSLGIIAFEMVYPFGTRSERGIVLNQLGTGLFPKDFESHKLAEGIKAMLHEDRDKRWDCAQVRKWLNRKLQEEN